MYTISATQEPSLVQTVVSTVTMAGKYLDRSGARFLIGRGDVIVNGLKIKDVGMSLEPGLYTMRIQGHLYDIELEAVEKE